MITTSITTLVSYGYLRQIYIAVPCQMIKQTKALLTNLTTREKLTSWMTNKWYETEDRELKVDVKILSNTGLKEDKLITLLADVKQSLDAGQFFCSTVSQVLDPDTVVVEISDLYEMSANINQGIIRYLQEQDDITIWKTAVEKAFNIHISLNNVGGNVGGTLQDIILFEAYLQSEFPKHPSMSPVKDVHPPRSMNLSENKAELVETKDVFKQISKLDLGGKGNITVYICTGDIANSIDDCIISPTHMFISKHSGVAQRLSEKGGDEYKDACIQLEKQGKLYSLECRVSGAGGDLHCKKIIHISIPHFECVNIETLKMLEIAVFYCFETAGAYGYQSVAIPAVGTGIGPITIEHCGQQINRAINRYKKNSKYVSHVNIVVLEENMAQQIKIDDFDEITDANASLDKHLVAFGNRIQVYLPPFKSRIEVDAVVVNSVTHLEQPLVTYLDPVSDIFNSSWTVKIRLPMWNPLEYHDITEFEREVQCKMESLINLFNQHKWEAVALPLFGESDKPESFQSPLLRASVAIVHGLDNVKHCKNVKIIKLYMLSSNMDFVNMFYNVLTRKNCFKLP
ncbi:uncharacterized protein LOC127841518 [Dreissena polymorpha]|nr:uncharacterized protein LOC127841518 [Dreissena polymorpha]